MVCLHCGSETQVINSRPQKRTNQVWRRRQCLACRATFTTEEMPDYGLAWLVQASSGAVEPFSRDKLFLSLFRSLQHRKTAMDDATALTATIISKLLPLVQEGRISSAAIVRAAQVALNRFDSAASTHYGAFHA